MSWHASPVVRSLGIALSAAAAASDCAQQAIHLPPPIVLTLPPSGSSTAPAPPRPPPESGSYGPSRADSVAVCTAALRTVEREALGREPLGLLLLQRFMPPDTSLEHELLRRRVIAGICEVANPFGNTCSNGVRGLTASFEKANRSSSSTRHSPPFVCAPCRRRGTTLGSSSPGAIRGSSD